MAPLNFLRFFKLALVTSPPTCGGGRRECQQLSNSSIGPYTYTGHSVHYDPMMTDTTLFVETERCPSYLKPTPSQGEVHSTAQHSLVLMRCACCTSTHGNEFECLPGRMTGAIGDELSAAATLGTDEEACRRWHALSRTPQTRCRPR